MAESSITQASDAVHSFKCILDGLRPRSWSRKSTLIQRSKQTPKTSIARRQASLSEHPVSLAQISQLATDGVLPTQTFLYLAYGSNLSAETFRGKRNIHPLSQMNVVVPEISLTFDLAGIPYTEPCFGNTRYRAMDGKDDDEQASDDYHKDRWKKGLVGVLYEVTAEDYAHIIATEGGGSGYQDILVDCYALDDDANKDVPEIPSGPAIKAHTLFAPASKGRPNPSYAQPSARYKKLITDGAEEHDLPHEYRDFLDGIRTYHMTTTKQQMGQWIFNALWLPILGFLFLGGARIFLRKDGTYPPWFVDFATALFRATWASYDNFFKPMFGDGERSIENGGQEGEETVPNLKNEKSPLLSRQGSPRIRASYDLV